LPPAWRSSAAVRRVTIAKASLVFSALVDVIVYASHLAEQPSPGDATVILAASLLTTPVVYLPDESIFSRIALNSFRVSTRNLSACAMR
jgi:hypothetical protein